MIGEQIGRLTILAKNKDPRTKRGGLQLVRVRPTEKGFITLCSKEGKPTRTCVYSDQLGAEACYQSLPEEEPGRQHLNPFCKVYYAPVSVVAMRKPGVVTKSMMLGQIPWAQILPLPLLAEFKPSVPQFPRLEDKGG